MTKEEIIHQFPSDVEYGMYSDSDIEQMMDTYAAQQAEGFAEWLGMGNWFNVTLKENIWFQADASHDYNLEEKTTTELYQLYLKQQK